MGPGMSLLRFLSFLVFLRYDTWVRKYYCYCLRTKKEVHFELDQILQSSPSRLQHHQKSKTEPRNKKKTPRNPMPGELHRPTTLHACLAPSSYAKYQRCSQVMFHHKRSHVRSDTTPNPLQCRPTQRPAGTSRRNKAERPDGNHHCSAQTRSTGTRRSIPLQQRHRWCCRAVWRRRKVERANINAKDERM